MTGNIIMLSSRGKVETSQLACAYPGTNATLKWTKINISFTTCSTPIPNRLPLILADSQRIGVGETKQDANMSNDQTKYAWRKDPLREILRQEIIDGKITPDMKPMDVSLLRPEYASMHKDKKLASRLKGARESIAKAANKPKKEPPWNKKNPLWQMMRYDILDGSLYDDIPTDDVIEFNPEYKAMRRDLLKSRLKSMQSQINVAMDRAAEDALHFFHDRQLHPRPTHNFRGEPEWVDHDAKELLGIDMDNDEHKTKTPAELWGSRLQYQDFLLSTFRQHIYQEEHSRKWAKQWVEGKKEYAIVAPIVDPQDTEEV